jgi:hypothetical protein
MQAAHCANSPTWMTRLDVLSQLGKLRGESEQFLFMAAGRISEGTLILPLSLVLGQGFALARAIFFAHMLADKLMTIEDSNPVVRSDDVDIVVQ